MYRSLFVVVGIALCGGAVERAVGWNPSAGDWGKVDDADLRVMTWNLNSRIHPAASTSEGRNAWTATARIVAVLQPDVLLLQEAGNSTNQSNLTALLEEWLNGGPGIEAWVRKYAPAYELPHIYVSAITDGFNRNVVLSRFPFEDLNEDGIAVRGDIPTITSDLYAPGGDGGLRGFMFTEIDLPDGTYVGDLVIGNAHLKAFSSGHIQRITAAKNVAYYVDYVFNGAGTGVADPRGSVRRLPASTVILGPNTPVVLGGDWNEDEVKNGTQRGPADWLTQAEVVGGADGTDADRSDMTYDTAVDLITASRVTQSSSKLDYIAWQDSIAVARQAFVFNTQSFAQAPNWMPVAFDGVPRPTGLSTTASDHLPVIVDLMLPRAAPTVCGDANCDGVLDFFDIDPFVLALIRGESVWEAQFDCDYLSANDIDRDGDVGFFDVDPFVAALLGGGCE